MSKAIPKLRFKEFKDRWQQLTLENFLISYRLGGNYENSESDSGIPLIKMGNLGRGNIVLDKIQYVSSSEVLDEKDKIKYGDLFFNTRNTLDLVGKVAIWRNELQVAYYNSNLMYLEFKDNFFMNYRLNSFQGIKSLRRLATGTTSVAAIYTKDLLKVRLLIPTLPEQQKIASFLSAIDEKIQQLTRKRELLEQYKKGVMQQLFSGKLRFKDENGKAYPKWEEKLYEDIFSFYTTNSFSRENLNYETGEVKNIHYGDIHTKFSSRFEVSEEIVPYINANVDLSKVKEENYCQEGDLVIADASEDYADIGKTIELIKLNKEKVVAGLHTFLARPNKTKMHKGFSGYLVQAPYVRKQVMTIAQGTKVLSLSPGRLGKVKLKVPCLEEQQKIASYISALDTKIESVATQITQTQTFKKGLLQQMFV
jgi:type I restriction enzyme S subunit